MNARFFEMPVRVDAEWWHCPLWLGMSLHAIRCEAKVYARGVSRPRGRRCRNAAKYMRRGAEGQWQGGLCTQHWKARR